MPLAAATVPFAPSCPWGGGRFTSSEVSAAIVLGKLQPVARESDLAKVLDNAAVLPISMPIGLNNGFKSERVQFLYDGLDIVRAAGAIADEMFIERDPVCVIRFKLRPASRVFPLDDFYREEKINETK